MTRPRLWGVTLSLAVLAGSALMPVASASVAPMVTPTPTPTWAIDFPSDTVPVGMPYKIVVNGPPNGSFNVTLNYAPYNRTFAFYVGNYTLPDVANGTGPDAVLAVGLNTTRWDVGTVQVAVATPNDTAYEIVYSTVFVNLTAIQAALAQLEAQQLALTARQQSEEANLTYEQNEMTLVWWGVGIYSVVLGLIVLFTRPSVQAKGLGRRFVARIRRIGRGVPFISYDEGWPTRFDNPPPDPNHVYIGLAFPECLSCTTVQSQESIADHLRTDHRIERPTPGLHYAVYDPAVRSARLARPASAVGRKVFRATLDGIDPDLSGVLSGR